jgi:hypothetical protein
MESPGLSTSRQVGHRGSLSRQGRGYEPAVDISKLPLAFREPSRGHVVLSREIGKTTHRGSTRLLAVAVMLVAATAPGSEGAAPRHVIYLHGRIVQQEQSARPRHPRFGYYELEGIEKALRDRGFVVHAGIRPRSASVSESADRVVDEIRGLLAQGAPADHVTVVGASMGGAIALVASARLQNPEVRFCVLGGCLAESVRRVPESEGKGLSGHILSIREASDDLTGPCPTWSEDGKPRSGLCAREVVLHTGLSHGFLYRPLPEWIDPVVEWAAKP